MTYLLTNNITVIGLIAVITQRCKSSETEASGGLMMKKVPSLSAIDPRNELRSNMYIVALVHATARSHTEPYLSDRGHGTPADGSYSRQSGLGSDETTEPGGLHTTVPTRPEGATTNAAGCSYTYTDA